MMDTLGKDCGRTAGGPICPVASGHSSAKPHSSCYTRVKPDGPRASITGPPRQAVVPLRWQASSRRPGIHQKEHGVENIDPKLRKSLSGISGILVTPFDASDNIAPERLRPIIDRAVAAGVHMLVANGNTGEFYGLTARRSGEDGARGRGDPCRPRSAHRRRGQERRRRVRARQGIACGRRASAHGASAAGSVRLRRAVSSSTSSAWPTPAAACRSCCTFATTPSASMRSSR